jgi:hypothetical protein
MKSIRSKLTLLRIHSRMIPRTITNPRINQVSVVMFPPLASQKANPKVVTMPIYCLL